MVSNGLCEHLRACEQCVYFCEHANSVYFCEHEDLSNFTCKQRALQKNTDGEQRALRVLCKFSAGRNLSFINRIRCFAPSNS